MPVRSAGAVAAGETKTAAAMMPASAMTAAANLSRTANRRGVVVALNGVLVKIATRCIFHKGYP